MPLKLVKKTDSQGRWFTLSDDIELKVRALTSTTIRTIEQQAQTGRQIPDPRTKRMIAEIDPEKREDLLTDFLLEDWRGVVDEDGTPVPVTLEAKKALLDIVTISDFVWEAARSLDILSDREKNSPTP